MKKINENIFSDISYIEYQKEYFNTSNFTEILYCIKIITLEKINILNTLIFIQIILSTISVYIFY